jgi:hypothetical protein
MELVEGIEAHVKYPYQRVIAKCEKHCENEVVCCQSTTAASKSRKILRSRLRPER